MEQTLLPSTQPQIVDKEDSEGCLLLHVHHKDALRQIQVL